MTTPVARGSRGNRGTTLAYFFMFICLIYFFIPLIWLALSSTKSNSDLFNTFGFWFGNGFNLFQNIQDLLARDNGAFPLWMRNTFIYATTAAFGSAIISALAGYAFAQFRFWGRDVLFAIVIVSVFVPATVFAVPLYLLLSKSGLTNSLLAVILPALVNPFGVYLMRIYSEQAVPSDLLDAARVDGAGEFRIFATIAFRLIAPGFVTVLLFAFVGAWNNFFFPLLVLSRNDLFPVIVGLQYWNSLAAQSGNNQILFAIIVTGAVIAILPIMLLFLLLQRYWQNGLALGSIKG